jgi:hypothetical protein
VRVTWSNVDGADCLRLSGAPALRGLPEQDVARHLRVYPSHAVATQLPAQAVAGTYAYDGDDVCFVPRFGFVSGMSYTALVHRDGAPAFDLEDFDSLTIVRVADDGPPTTRVVAIHPSGADVPRNLLRLYVHFSAPMSEGCVEGHVHVIDDDTGEPLLGAFLPMDPELWDRERRRVTVLFDPARIKRGLAPHREIGYPLHDGATVSVVVDEGFVDAGGRPLVEPIAHRYRVGADARVRVDPAAWAVEPVAAGTHAPLVVRFDRPLDHGLLQHCLAVLGPDGARVAGDGTVGDEERSWVFTPSAPWVAASCALVVDPMLEDLAGNSVTRVFDRDLADPEQSPIAPGPITVEFRPA